VVSTPTVDPAVAEPPPVDGSTGTGSGRELVPPAPPVKEARRARITWRVLVFALALVLLVGIGALAVSVISRGSYFVALTDDNEVAIFKGRPGGVLWIEPTIEMRSGLCNREAPGKYRTMLRNGRSFGDLAAAQELVENMIAEAEEMATASGEPLSGGRCDADSAANPDGEPTSATSAPATPTTAPIAGSPDEQ